VGLIILLMEVNHLKPRVKPLESSPERDLPFEEVYQMPRQTIAASKGKKAQKKKLNSKLTT
jgi:hypothetical protein